MSKSNGLLEHLAKNAPVLPEETVHVEQWGRDVTLRGLTSRERDLFEEDNLNRGRALASNGAGQRNPTIQADLKNFRARLVARHIVENGMRPFANARGEELLGDQPAKVLDRLFAISQRLSGFSAEDVEALAKNFEVIPGNEPSTDSLGSQDEPSVS